MPEPDIDALLAEGEKSGADIDSLLAEGEQHVVPQRTEAPSRTAKLPESDLPFYHPEKGVTAGLVRGFMGNLGTGLAGKLLPQREEIDGIPATYAGNDVGQTLESNFQQEKAAHPTQVGAGQVISSLPAAYLGARAGAGLAATAGEAALGAGLGGMAPTALESFNEAQGGPGAREEAAHKQFADNPGTTAAGITLPAVGEAAAPVMNKVAKPLIDWGNRGLARIGLSGKSIGRIIGEEGKQGLAKAGEGIRNAGLDKPRKLTDYFSPPDPERLALNAHEVTSRLGGPKGEITRLEDTMARTTHPDLRASDNSLLPFGDTAISRDKLIAPLRAASGELEGRAASDAEKTIRAYKNQERLFQKSAKPTDLKVSKVAPPPIPAPPPKLLGAGIGSDLAPYPAPWRAPKIHQAQVQGLGEAPPIVPPAGAPEIQPPLLPPEGSPAASPMPPPMLPAGPGANAPQLPAETNALRALPGGQEPLIPPAPFRKPGSGGINNPSPIVPPAPEQTALAPVEGDFTSLTPGTNGPPLIPQSTSIQKFDPGNVPSIWQRIKMRMPGAPAQLPPPEMRGLPPGMDTIAPPAPEVGPVPGALGRGGKYPPESVMDAEFEPMGPPVETPQAPPVFPRQRTKIYADEPTAPKFDMAPEGENPYTFTDALKDKRAIGQQLFKRDKPMFQQRVGQQEADELAWRTLKDQTSKRVDEGLSSGVLNPTNVADYKTAMKNFGPAADVAIDAGAATGRAMKRPDGLLKGGAAFASDAAPQIGHSVGKGIQHAAVTQKELAKAAGAYTVGSDAPIERTEQRGITSADVQARNIDQENKQKQELNESMKKSLFQRWYDKM